MRLYEKGIAILDHVRKITGLSKWDFLELLAKEDIPLHYGEEGLKEDLGTTRKLSKKTGRLLSWR
ncbi:MAG: UPF0175 family protein [Caldisphaeraceae archaeon]|nr:UPF0175 family protein [Caldisphaeraceae archaeon]